MAPNLKLEFDTWGTGVAHAAAWNEQVGEVCERCQGRKKIGPPTLAAGCPDCDSTGRTLEPPA